MERELTISDLEKSQNKVIRKLAEKCWFVLVEPIDNSVENSALMQDGSGTRGKTVTFNGELSPFSDIDISKEENQRKVIDFVMDKLKIFYFVFNPLMKFYNQKLASLTEAFWRAFKIKPKFVFPPEHKTNIFVENYRIYAVATCSDFRIQMPNGEAFIIPGQVSATYVLIKNGFKLQGIRTSNTFLRKIYLSKRTMEISAEEIKLAYIEEEIGEILKKCNSEERKKLLEVIDNLFEKPNHLELLREVLAHEKKYKHYVCQNTNMTWDFPNAIRLKIIENISLIDLLSFRSTSMSNKLLVESNNLWKEMCNRHFNDIRNSGNKKMTSGYYFSEFVKLYKQNYKGLDPNVRRLFTLIKDGDAINLKFLLSKLEDKRSLNKIFINVFKITDKKNLHWLHWILKQHSQDLKNIIYETIKNLFEKEGNVLNNMVKKQEFFPLLHWAVVLNQSDEEIRNVYELNPASSGEEICGFTPLYFAAYNGLRLAVEKLLNVKPELHSEPNCNSKRTDKIYDPLLIAAEKGHTEIVKFFIEKGYPVNLDIESEQESLLHIAAAHGHVQILEFLLKNGADVNYCIPSIGTALHVAAQSGHEDCVKILLTYRANPMAYIASGLPLNLAAKQGHSSIVSLLLNANSDPNCPSSTGATSLYIAAECGHTECVKKLFNSGADLNYKDQGCTALYIATCNGYLKIVELLVQWKVNVNQAICWDVNPYLKEQKNIETLTFNLDSNSQGVTPFFAAIKMNRIEIVKIFLENGANVTNPFFNEELPIYTAVKGGCDAIIAMLLYTMDYKKFSFEKYYLQSEIYLKRAEILIDLDNLTKQPHKKGDTLSRICFFNVCKKQNSQYLTKCYSHIGKLWGGMVHRHKDYKALEGFISTAEKDSNMRNLFNEVHAKIRKFNIYIMKSDKKEKAPNEAYQFKFEKS